MLLTLNIYSFKLGAQLVSKNIQKKVYLNFCKLAIVIGQSEKLNHDAMMVGLSRKYILKQFCGPLSCPDHLCLSFFPSSNGKKEWSAARGSRVSADGKVACADSHNAASSLYKDTIQDIHEETEMLATTEPNLNTQYP